MRKSQLFVQAAGIALASALLASPALAQVSGDSSKLEDIVVTAQKREENLQTTPLAISAVTATQLDLRGISQSNELSAIAPNVSAVGGTTSGAAAVITIRGIPTSADETQGFDSPVGIYLDGVYLARSSALSFEVADIERVEVLRGPQGTLFGRNTTGGAINFVTKKPSTEASIKLDAGGGNFGMSKFKIIANTGNLGGSNDFRISLGYYHHHRDGVVDNLLQPSNLDPGSDTTDSARAAIYFKPAGSNLELTNTFDYTRSRAAAYVMQLAAVGDGTFRPNVTINGQTFAATTPANVLGYLNSATSLNTACPNVVTRVFQPTICDPTDGPSVDKIWGDTFKAELSLPGVTIRSTTAYRDWKNTIGMTDLDGLGPLRGYAFTSASTLNGMPVGTLNFLFPTAPGTAAFLASQSVPTTTQPLFSADNNRGQHQFSQELELVSNNKSDFQWVLGAFYFKEHGYETNNQSIGFVLDTNQAVFNSTNFGALAGLLQAGNPARFRVVSSPTTLAYTADGRSFAIYGQATYRPSALDGKLGVTLGLRYTWDRKQFSRTQNGPLPFTSATDLANNIGQSANFSAPTGHLTIDYRASDEVNLYARVARGYRSGGFNARSSTNGSATSTLPLGPSIAPLSQFNDETIWSYEIGAKMEFLHRFRLNLAGFHNVYTNQQVTLPVPIVGAGSFGTQTINAGKTTYTGFEVEAMAKINNYLTLDGNFGYIDIKIKDYPAFDLTGIRGNIASLIAGQGYAPKYTLNLGGTFSYPVGREAKLVARLGYNYTSSYEMFPNTLTQPFQQVGKGDARGLLEGQLRLENFGLGNKMSLTVWGKNLTNKHYVTRSVDFGQLGFATVIYGEPRTFGATLHAEF
jgi:iron complex outermembrane receptor protein